MHSSRNGFRITGGILTIVICCLIVVDAIITISAVAGLVSELNDSGLMTAIIIAIATCVIIIAISLSGTVLGALLCANKKPRALAITLIIFMAILAVIQFAGSRNSIYDETNFFTIVFGILCLINALVMTIYVASSSKFLTSGAETDAENKS